MTIMTTAEVEVLESKTSAIHLLDKMHHRVILVRRGRRAFLNSLCVLYDGLLFSVRLQSIGAKGQLVKGGPAL